MRRLRERRMTAAAEDSIGDPQGLEHQHPGRHQKDDGEQGIHADVEDQLLSDGELIRRQAAASQLCGQVIGLGDEMFS